MAFLIRNSVFKFAISCPVSRISQNILKFQPLKKIEPCLRSGKKLGFCIGFLGLSLKKEKDSNQNIKKSFNDFKEYTFPTRDYKVRHVKRGLVSSIIYYLYDFACILMRAFRLGIFFIPILTIYPITFFGGTIEKFWWQTLLKAIESSGPIFIKLGQWASTRHDLFPNACCLQFAKLQRRARAHSWQYTKKVLQRSFGKNWRKIFVKFDNNREPIGSGCVAQVYKAWISPSSITNEKCAQEFTNDCEEENEDNSVFLSDGLEVLGFGKYFTQNQEEDFQQNEAFTEWRNYRNEKRAAAAFSSVKDPSKDVSFQSIESVAGDLAEELVEDSPTNKPADPTLPKLNFFAGSENDEDLKTEDSKQVDHILAEQWLESLDAYEKSLPVGDINQLELEGLVPVAVKICHPDVNTMIRRDMLILRFSAYFLTYLCPPLKWLSLPQCVDEFEKFLSAQVDMREEAKNLQKFSYLFSDVESVRFPKPIMNMVNSKVLVESFEEGEPISDIIASNNLETLKQSLANIGVSALLKMVFIDNFTHGDLHPGNVLVQNRCFDDDKKAQKQDGNISRLIMMDVGADIFVMDVVPDPNPLRICLLDCGVVSQLGERELELFKSVITEVVKGDGGSVADLFLKHSVHNCSNTESFKTDMKKLVDESRDKVTSLEKVDLGNLLHDVLSLLLRHKVRLDSSFGSIIISMIVLEGLGRALDPNLDLLDKAREHLLA